MYNDYNAFVKLKQVENEIKVRVVTGDYLPVNDIGNITVMSIINGQSIPINIANAYYVPNLVYNLLMVKRLTKLGFFLNFY